MRIGAVSLAVLCTLALLGRPAAAAPAPVPAPAFTEVGQPAVEAYRLPNPWQSSDAALALQAPPRLNTWSAAGLSLGAPFLFFGLGLAAIGPLPPAQSGMLAGPLLLGSPFGLVAGYHYVGEPARGWWVGAGASAIIVAGFAAAALSGYKDIYQGVYWLMYVLPVQVAAMVAYLGWVVWDLDQIVKRKNQETERRESTI